jgi:5-hydroxyisourate hydrolase
MSLSTHVLDTARGEPAADVPVRLQRHNGSGWVTLSEGRTGADGRLRLDEEPLPAGRYRLVFDTAAYLGEAAFFPEAAVVFAVREAERHYHLPLLLSPFGYTTYRGS